MLLAVFIILVLFLLLCALLKVGVLDLDEHLRDRFVLLASVILSHDQVWKTREVEEVDLHDALGFHVVGELREELVLLQMGSLLFENHAAQVFRLDALGRFWQLCQEVEQRLFILVSFAQIVLEVCVELAALVDDVLVICLESLHDVLKEFIQVLDVAIEAFLERLSEPLPLFPNLQLGLEIGKSLPDQFHVKNGAKTLLVLAEGFELGLKCRHFKSAVSLCRALVPRALILIVAGC